MKALSGIVLAISLLLPSPSLAQQEQKWVQLAQVGSPLYDLTCVQFLDSLRGWLGGGSVGYAYTRDGGLSWQASQGQFWAPHALSMYDTLVGWAVSMATGVDGAIAKTTDGGHSWVQDPVLTNTPLLSVAALSRTHCIAVGDTNGYPDRGVMLTTSDGGVSWLEEVRTDTISTLKQIQFTDSLHGWILYWFDAGAGLLTTRDGGNSWEKRQVPAVFGYLSFLDSLSGFAVTGGYANLYKTTDGGRSWVYRTFIDPANQPIPKSLSFADTLNGWLFSLTSQLGDLSETIYRTHDGGLSWQQESVGLTARIFSAQMLDTLHGWAACSGGVVLGYHPTATSVKDRAPNALATSFQLYQNYPNPFNSSTSIEYQLAHEGEVTLTVSDLLGRTITVLVNKRQQAGFYRTSWEATTVGSGVYFYTLTIRGGRREAKRLMLLK